MAKPQPIRIPSDNCIVTIDGVEYRPHENEWVEVLPGLKVGHQKLIAEMNALRAEFETLEDDAEQDDESGLAARRRINELAAQYNDKMIDFLRQRLVAWNWTDELGRPLPELDGTERPFELLSAEELGWLLAACRGDVETESKNS